MRRGVLAGAVLALLIVAMCAGVALAAPEHPQTGTDTGIMVQSARDATEAGGDQDIGDVSEPTAEPTEQPVPTTEPSEQPSGEPTETGHPTAEPTSAQAAPALEVSGSATFNLHEETPEIRIVWSGGKPGNVAGYVWSYGLADGALNIFNISYDGSRLELPAGALNGHIHEAGTYVVHCQPVDSDQKAATPAANVRLVVKEGERRLAIRSSRPFPVAAGSSVELTADIGEAAGEVVRYEWKPSESNPDSATCRLRSVAAGAVRYTCTAVLEGGERITGTILVTGTQLQGSQKAISLSYPKADSLEVSWSNGSPAQNMTYIWRVRGENDVDLSAHTGSALPLDALRSLSPRTNPYVVTCQAYEGHSPIGRAVSFNVRANGNPGAATISVDPQPAASGVPVASAGASVAPGAPADASQATQGQMTGAPRPSGPIPNTDDPARIGPFCFMAALAIGAIVWAASSLARRILR